MNRKTTYVRGTKNRKQHFQSQSEEREATVINGTLPLEERTETETQRVVKRDEEIEESDMEDESDVEDESEEEESEEEESKIDSVNEQSVQENEMLSREMVREIEVQRDM